MIILHAVFSGQLVKQHGTFYPNRPGIVIKLLNIFIGKEWSGFFEFFDFLLLQFEQFIDGAINILVKQFKLLHLYQTEYGAASKEAGGQGFQVFLLEVPQVSHLANHRQDFFARLARDSQIPIPGEKGVDPYTIIIGNRQYDIVIAVQVDNQIIFGPQR